MTRPARRALAPLCAAALVASATPGCAGTRSSAASPTLRAAKIEGFEFRPRELSVSLGDTIAWTNADIVAHSVTADDNTFDSPDVPARERFVWVASKTGTFTYHCEVHPTMTGKVVVK
jgi:plastocyanin